MTSQIFIREGICSINDSIERRQEDKIARKVLIHHLRRIAKSGLREEDQHN
jgi:hypothetical protein